MDEVLFTTDKVKLPSSKKLVDFAISRIPRLYPSDPVIYKGYYREYLRKGDDFINLFESILNLIDFGPASQETYLASLDYKRLNSDFEIDSTLFRTYENRKKFVPW